MKNVFTLMLGLVAGTASFAASSTPSTLTTPTRVVMTTNQKVNLFVDPIQARGNLDIQDASGHTLYNSVVSLKKGLKQQFDVSNLGVGTYKLTLTADHKTMTRTFVVQASPNENFVVQE